MRGLLEARIPERTRALALVPAVLVLGVLLTLALGMTNALPLPLVVVLGFLLGAAVALLLLGRPSVASLGLRAGAFDARRRWWIFPLVAVVAAAVLYVPLGLLLAPVLPPSLSAVAPVTLTLLAGIAVAAAAVGVPQPLPGARRRWRALRPRSRLTAVVALVLLVGVVLTVVLGVALTALPVPRGAVLPAALVVGFGLALGAGARLGARPPPVDLDALDPVPRVVLAFLAWVVTGTLLFVTVGFLGLDVLPALLLAFTLAIVPAAWVAGILRRGGTGERRRLPVLPDKVKPLVLLPIWVVAGLAILAGLAYAGLAFVWAAAAGTLGGLAVAVLVVEGDLVRREIRSWGRRLPETESEREP